MRPQLALLAEATEEVAVTVAATATAAQSVKEVAGVVLMAANAVEVAKETEAAQAAAALKVMEEVMGVGNP